MASGWTTDGVVVRTNGRTSGPTIWNNDATAGQVIDSAGHDINDETLADSIEECLNLKGYNAMLANLNVGSFRIVALAAGTAATDAVNKTQLDAVAAGVATNASDISDLEFAVGDNIIDIDALEDAVQVNTDDIAINTGTIATHTDQISSIQGVNAAQTSLINTNISDISNLETAVDTNTDDIAINTAAIAALGDGMELDFGLANGEYSGITCDFIVRAGTPSIAPGTAVRFYVGTGAVTIGEVEAATADSLTNSRVIGVSVGTATISAGGTVKVLIQGFMSKTTWTWTTKGQALYLASSVGAAPGLNLTTSKPGTGVILQVGVFMSGGLVFVGANQGYQA